MNRDLTLDEKAASLKPKIEIVLDDSVGSWVDGAGRLTFTDTSAARSFSAALASLHLGAVRSDAWGETSEDVELNHERAVNAGFNMVRDSSILYISFPTLVEATSAIMALRTLPFVKCANYVLEAVEASELPSTPPTDVGDFTDNAAPADGITFPSGSEAISSAWWWNRHSVGAAWNAGGNGTFQGSSVRVAVIDFGFIVSDASNSANISWDHADQVYYHDNGSGYTPETSDASLLGNIPASEPWHGTSCAMLIGGKSNTGWDSTHGFAGGVAPQATIVPIAVDMSLADIAYGIQQAVALNPAVISISLVVQTWNGTQYDETPIEDDPGCYNQLVNAYNADECPVISAGNTNNWIDYTTDSMAMVVGGMDNGKDGGYYISGNGTSGSGEGTSWGPRVDVAAAAVDVGVASASYPYDTPYYNSSAFGEAGVGTSFAAPLVAGTCALMRQFPLTKQQMRGCLIYSSDYERFTDWSYATTKKEENPSGFWLDPYLGIYLNYSSLNIGDCAQIRSLNAFGAVVAARAAAQPYAVWLDDADYYNDLWVNGSYQWTENMDDDGIGYFSTAYAGTTGSLNPYSNGSGYALGYTLFNYGTMETNVIKGIAPVMVDGETLQGLYNPADPSTAQGWYPPLTFTF